MKICLNCQKEIQRTNFSDSWEYNRAKYCNNTCYQQGHTAKITIHTCEHCLVVFTKKGSKGSTRFCSSTCRYQAARTEGKRYIDKNGYIKYKLKHGYVFEHRMVAEQKLGRPIKPNEHVHHRNHHKQDNSPENLEVCSSNSKHISIHAAEYQERGEPLPINRPEAIAKRWPTRKLRNI